MSALVSTSSSAISRRKFLTGAATASLAWRAFAQHASSQPQWVLLGTDKGQGIYRARWNSATGEIGMPELAIETDRPAFFAMHPKLPVLYAVNSAGGAQAGISAFRVNVAQAELTLINRLSSHGDGPCFVSADATGQSAFVANYSGGSMSAYRLGPKGELAQTVGVFRYDQPAHGPVKDRQDASHLHCTTVSPGNDFVLTCDLGDDLILLFPIAPSATVMWVDRCVYPRVRVPGHVMWRFIRMDAGCTAFMKSTAPLTSMTVMSSAGRPL